MQINSLDSHSSNFLAQLPLAARTLGENKMAQVDARQFEDKDFVLTYFAGAESGQDISNRLQQDNITLSAPDLIARLVGWLAESDDTSEEDRERARQEMTARGLASQQPSSETSSDSSSESEGGGSGQESTAPSASSNSSTSASSGGESGEGSGGTKGGFFGSPK